MSDDCIFCKIIAGNIPSHKVYEDESLFAFLDIHPINAGHTLLITKRHAENLQSCPPDDRQALATVLPDLALAVISAVNADSYNVLLNNGSAAGQLVSHVHFHIIPRFDGDQALTHAPTKNLDDSRMQQIVRDIIRTL